MIDPEFRGFCSLESQQVSLLSRYASENVNKLLVGNKSDLTSKRAVSFDQAKVQIKCSKQMFNTILSYNISVILFELIKPLLLSFPFKLYIRTHH